MAIKCVSGTDLITTAVSGSVTTGTSPTYDQSGVYDSTGGYYRGTDVRTYSGKIVSVLMTSNGANVQYAITGEKTVQFFYVSSVSGKTQSFSANVTYEPAPVIVENVVAASGSTVDYLNTTKDTTKYMWTRPTAFDLQLPWSYIASWSLSRAGWGSSATDSMCVDSTAGVVASSSVYASPTSGTNVFTIPQSAGIRYGDYLTLTLTPKFCATLSKTTFNCKVARGNTSIKDTSFASGKSFKTEVSNNAIVNADISGGVWSLDSSSAESVRKAGTAKPEFTFTVTKAAGIKDLAIKIEAQNDSLFTECWYTKGWNITSHKDDACDVYSGSTKLSTSSYTEIGTIPAGTLSKSWTLKVATNDVSDAIVSWPKSVVLDIRYTITGGTHCFTDSVGFDAVLEGNWTTGGDNTGSGPVGS